jgi:hypothetical protein
MYFYSFSMLHQEKSGNPDRHYFSHIDVDQFKMTLDLN